MRLVGWNRWSALVVTLFCAGMLVAQEEKGEKGKKSRRDRGDQKGERRGEKGFGFGGMRMPGMGQGQIAMLENADVQKDLQLTDDQKASLPLLKEEFKEADEKFGESFRDQSLSREDRTAKVTERNKEIDKQIGELLGEKHKRFKQIQLQAIGVQGALFNPFSTETSQKVGITDEQREKVRDMQRESFQEMRDLFQSAGDDPDARRKLMEESRAKQEAKIMALLTDKQKATWKELIGTPITFKLPGPQFGFGGGRGGRPGGPPPGGNPPPPPAKTPPPMS